MHQFLKRSSTLRDEPSLQEPEGSSEPRTAGSDSKEQAGFTLIELLVVIAIIGVLAAIVIATINPLEQLARGRDASRKAAITQLGKALESYSVQKSAYPAVSSWDTDLVSSGDILKVPQAPSGAVTTCDPIAPGNMVNGFCYKGDSATPTNAVLYTKLESTAEKSKCPDPSTNIPYALWSSSDGRAGLVCTANTTIEPGVGPQTFQP